MSWYSIFYFDPLVFVDIVQYDFLFELTEHKLMERVVWT